MEATAFSSEALEAMRFNGLGFVNKRLCLMVQFYENHTPPTLFRQTKLALWLAVAFLLGPQIRLFAQPAPLYKDFNALWESVEMLLGQPDADAGRFFTFKKMQADSLLAQAEAYIVSFKNDSAVLISRQMLHVLKRQNQHATPLGLKAQLVLARALEHNDADSISLRLLLHVKEACQKEGPWDTYVKSSLALALLYENMGRPSQCLEYLNYAKSGIDRNDLQAYYPQYAMRACSYYRVFTSNADSAVYYAREVLRTAPIYNLTLEEAWGHLLMDMLRSKDTPDPLEHLNVAATLFIKIEDYTGLSYAFGGIADKHFRNGDLNKAMAFNDSTIAAAQKSIAAGNKWNPALFGAYRFRAGLFRQLERHDSAWHYLQKGYEVELNFMRAKESAKAIEIDARYLNEKKARQIKTQGETIRFEKQIRKLLMVIFGITLLLAAGLAIGLVKHVRGMRELGKKNSLIQHQTEQLKSLDAAKSRFFANISHELRTPLTLLLGALSAIKKDSQLTQKQEKLVQLANRGGDEMRRLISEILDLGKLDAGKVAVKQEPVWVAGFFSNYFAQFESLAEQKKIHFNFESEVDKSVAVLLDKEKCRQIVYNLLSNAFKFTHTGGTVSGRLRFENGSLQLNVTDTGDGIHPEDLPHIFERYFQTNQVNSPAQGGTGIGLGLCREYVRLLGGSIEADSTIGKGSEFVVSFPVALVEREADSPETSQVLAEESPSTAADSGRLSLEKMAPLPGGAVHEKPTILVVEDNFELQAYIRLVLEEKCQVVTVENGQFALDCLKSTSNIQLIVSDLMMPVMDGYQLLEKLKSSDATRHIPVIMLTARAEARDRLKALRIGVDDYLTKPFDEEELLVRIDNLLKNKAARLVEPAAESSGGNAVVTLSEADQNWLKDFEKHVQENLASDLLNVPELARHFLMSESSLLRQLKRLTGLSPIQYLQEIRLAKARYFLENRSYDSVAKVASLVGYGDARNFSRSFKQRFGKLPSELLEA
ncbi:MAG: response regulator [Haliscomenobacter sp.]|nr:response regulator [Haliscomenobacter sp.]